MENQIEKPKIIWQGEVPLPKGCQTKTAIYRIILQQPSQEKPSDGLIVERLNYDTMGGECWKRDECVPHLLTNVYREAFIALTSK